MSTRTKNRRRVAAGILVSALSGVAASPSRAVIFYSTGDPTYNTTAPVGSLANTPWQYVGNWSAFSGIAIAPQYFITASHVGGNAGDAFNLNGINYTTIAFADGSANQRLTIDIGGTTYGTDLVIWRIAGTFPTFAPLYNSTSDGAETSVATASNPAVIIGRGTQRGNAVTLGSDPRGWEWGTQDTVRRWGTNVVASTNVALNDGRSTGYALKFNFDANPADRSGASASGYSGVNEAILSAGDSGGGLFIKNAAGKWKLAGVNWAVASGYSTAPNTTGPSAALFDTGGYYLGANQVPDTAADAPVSAYSSQISANLAAINVVIGNSWAWNVNADGNWTAPANWWNATSTLSPSGAGREIVFGSVITSPRTVTVNSNRTVGNLVFDGANSYTIGGANSLTLESGTPADSSSTVAVTVYSGNHTIAAPVVLNKSTTFLMDQPSSSLSIAGTFTPAAGTTITKAGPGTLVFPNLRVTVPVVINAGSVQIAPNGTAAGTSKLNSLTVNGGHLDLVNNDLIIDYTGSSPAETVRQYLQSGLNSGAWNGAGIVSSSAASDGQQRTAIAVAEASALLGLSGAATTTWSGQTVDATSLLLKYTWYGDANFDGRVNSDDYALIDRGLAKGLVGWINGDFNYDNVVNAADYALIDRAYIMQSGTLSPTLLAEREAQFGAEYVMQLLTVAPEPSLTACIVAGLVPLALRRRRD